MNLSGRCSFMFEAGGDKHIYLILTKRPEAYEVYIRNIEDWDSSRRRIYGLE